MPAFHCPTLLKHVNDETYVSEILRSDLRRDAFCDNCFGCDVSKDEIEQQKVSELSAMPQGLLNILTKQEIFDLLSFLEAAVDSTIGLSAQAEKK